MVMPASSRWKTLALATLCLLPLLYFLPSRLGLTIECYTTARTWMIVTGVISFIACLKIIESIKVDPREPPIVASGIPYVGHLIGILSRGSTYFKQLGRKRRLPIFTLPMPGSRLYVVTDPSLAASVQRASKVLSFSPLVPPIVQRVAGFDNATITMMRSDMDSGYIQQVQAVVHTRLSQGSYLDQVTLAACEEFRRRLDMFHAGELQSSSETNINLLSWTKNLVTVATASFFYGPNNPVEKNPQLVEQFWDFDAGIPGLLLGILPQWTARKAYQGREAVVKALRDYLSSSAYIEAAAITQERSTIGQNVGASLDAIARSDLTFFFAGIINTSLASFWMLANIYRRPLLLTAIRDELDAIFSSSNNEDPTKSILSIKSITKTCPLLHATFKEVLRLYSDNFATRLVLADTLLADTYFLQKNSIVQVSGGLIHADERIWGPDVADFKPERHLSSNQKNLSSGKGESGDDVKHKQVHPAAFRAFGGGETLCPGRHFALNEIVTLVALVLIQFDVQGQTSSEFSIPLKNDRVLPIHVLEPVEEIPVRIRRRKEWANRKLTLVT